MKTNKRLFTYKNTIILTNGASLKINSIKFKKNYQLNKRFFKEIQKIEILNETTNQLKFIKKVFN